MSRLETRALTKSFGALKVTDAVDLDVRPGELHAIIGPNGAGKTTLIAQLSGQLRPDAGRVLLDGGDITDVPMPRRVHMGLARSFQITQVLASFTVLENVALAVQARAGSSFRFVAPVAEDESLNAAARRVLAETGLQERAGIVAGTLSHGEHRLLELAMALATGPRVLLLDEPLAGVGGSDADAFLHRLRALKGRLTMVLIEHDMDAVFALADRVSVLVYGRLIATGTPDDIRSDPEVRAAYLGEEAAA